MNTIEIIFFILLSLVFYTYLGYGIILWALVGIKRIFVKEKSEPMPEELPEVTLFITAYNEEQVVDEKMQNCRELDYPKEKFKIVWVTDGSCDATNEKLKAYPDATVYYSAERKGKTAAMNRGIKFVTTPIVIFTDANTFIHPQAVREMVRCFNNPKVGCVAGEKRIHMHTKDGAAAGGEGMYWKYESFLKKLDAQLHSAVGAAGELFAIRTALYEQMPNDTLLDDFVLSNSHEKIYYRILRQSIRHGKRFGKYERGRKEKGTHRSRRTPGHLSATRPAQSIPIWNTQLSIRVPSCAEVVCHTDSPVLARTAKCAADCRQQASPPLYHTLGTAIIVLCRRGVWVLFIHKISKKQTALCPLLLLVHEYKCH